VFRVVTHAGLIRRISVEIRDLAPARTTLVIEAEKRAERAACRAGLVALHAIGMLGGVVEHSGGSNLPPTLRHALARCARGAYSPIGAGRPACFCPRLTNQISRAAADSSSPMVRRTIHVAGACAMH
jgi:hypothetical protein